MNRLSKFLYVGIVAIMATSCGNSNNSGGRNENPVPLFNADSCLAYVKAQTDFGPRVPNTDAHKECGIFLEDFFKRQGLETEIQEIVLTAYDGTRLNARNIIASVNPDTKSRIFLCAHWDSRPFCDEDPDPSNRSKPVTGANDGASGVAVLMELARIMAKDAPSIGVDLILFDAEDYGVSENTESYCLGSQYWAANIDKRTYKPSFGILLDMVGADDAVFLREAVSMRYAPFAVEMVWKRAGELGYSSMFLNENTGALIDDHYFINRISGIPCIDIIHYTNENGFPSTWHTADDTLENISRSTLSAVGDVLCHIIYELQ